MSAFDEFNYFLSQAEQMGIDVSNLRSKVQKITREMTEAFIKELDEGPSLSGTIVTKNAAKQIVVGPVLVPGEKDSDGESLTSQKIEQVAYDFMEHFRYVDLSHTLKQSGVPVSSDLLRFEERYEIDGEEMVLPAGTWMLGVKVHEDAWPDVESGSLKGFSVMGAKKNDVESFMAAKSAGPIGMHFDGTKYRKTLLKDLGPDWVGVAVSILPNPSVFKSRFIAVKEEGDSWYRRLLHGLKGKKKEEPTMPLTEEEKQEFTDLIKTETSAAVKAAVPEIVEAVTEKAKADPPPAEEPKENEEITALKGKIEEMEATHKKDLEKIDEFIKTVSTPNALKGSSPSEPAVPNFKRDIAGRRIYD